MRTDFQHYEKPPLVEAIFEFFSADAKPQKTHELLSSFQSSFPEFSAPPTYLQMTTFELELASDNPTLLNKESIQPRCRVTTPQMNEKNLLIQFDYSMFALNVLKPYSHYEPDYTPLLKKLFNFHIENSKTTKLRLIGQRYINHIILPEEAKPEDYFTFYPKFSSEVIGEAPPRFSMQIEHQHLTKGTVLLILNQDLKTPDNQLAFYLDIYARSDEEIPIDWPHIKAWYDEAHVAIKNGFEHAITDKTRSLFK